MPTHKQPQEQEQQQQQQRPSSASHTVSHTAASSTAPENNRATSLNGILNTNLAVPHHQHQSAQFLNTPPQAIGAVHASTPIQNPALSQPPIPDGSLITDPQKSRTFLMAMFLNDDHQHIPQLLSRSSPSQLDVNVMIDDQGHTALHWAAALGRVKVLELLIMKGASGSARNFNGETSLIRAVMVTNAYDYQVFPTLLAHLSESISLADSKNRTVLHHIAVSAGNKGRGSSSRYYMSCLLEHVAKELGMDQLKALVDSTDRNGDTAVHIAARSGCKPLVDMLVEAGADVHLRNRVGLRPVDFGVSLPTSSTPGLNGGNKKRQRESTEGRGGVESDEERKPNAKCVKTEYASSIHLDDTNHEAQISAEAEKNGSESIAAKNVASSVPASIPSSPGMVPMDFDESHSSLSPLAPTQRPPRRAVRAAPLLSCTTGARVTYPSIRTPVEQEETVKQAPSTNLIQSSNVLSNLHGTVAELLQNDKDLPACPGISLVENVQGSEGRDGRHEGPVGNASQDDPPFISGVSAMATTSGTNPSHEGLNAGEISNPIPVISPRPFRSTQVVSAVQKLLDELDAEFCRELDLKTQAMVQLQRNIKAATRRLADSRKAVAEERKKEMWRFECALRRINLDVYGPQRKEQKDCGYGSTGMLETGLASGATTENTSSALPSREKASGGTITPTQNNEESKKGDTELDGVQESRWQAFLSSTDLSKLALFLQAIERSNIALTCLISALRPLAGTYFQSELAFKRIVTKITRIPLAEVDDKIVRLLEALETDEVGKGTTLGGLGSGIVATAGTTSSGSGLAVGSAHKKEFGRLKGFMKGIREEELEMERRTFRVRNASSVGSATGAS